ncbi:MAG: HEAT repeat domain-containing protein [Pseudomonadota bacterium]
MQKLVRTALRFWESDKAWNAITTLQMRGSPETLALACTLARSQSCRKRSLGLYIASQLRKRFVEHGSGSVEYALNETQALLLAGLHDEHDEVVRAAISGFGHRPHPEALPELVRLSNHQRASIRWGVSIALGRYSEPMAIDALMRLARDADNAVRDWATFGLGTLQDADSPEILEVLWSNLEDKDSDVRSEALVGLAKRDDPRTVDYLRNHLNDDCQVYELEAAEKMASPSLLEPLLKLAAMAANSKVDSYWLGCLNTAIAACSAPAEQQAR